MPNTILIERALPVRFRVCNAVAGAGVAKNE
jgi:hypothetical protein